MVRAIVEGRQTPQAAARATPLAHMGQRHAKRLPRAMKPLRPGELVQLDTLFFNVAPDKPSSTSQLTTPVAKWTVALVGRATARCAAALLDKLIAGPLPHRGRDVGSGRAFSVGEARAGVALDGHVAPFQWACGRKFLARSDKTRGAGPGEGCCLGQFRSTEPCHATRSPHRRPFHRVFHVRRHARGRRRARARRRAKDLRLGGDVLPELYDPKGLFGDDPHQVQAFDGQSTQAQGGEPMIKGPTA